MPRAVKLLKNILFLIAMPWLGACAILGGGDDGPVKNLKVQAVAPDSPFEEVRVSSADRVWQSRKTGNTIAYNSACLEKIKEDLPTLEKGLLAGVDHMKIINQNKLTVDSAPAVRTRAEGRTDGIPISIDIIVIKKGNCTYDLAYVARTVTFLAELERFNKFIERFHTP